MNEGADTDATVRFIESTRFDDLPPEVIEHSKQDIADFIGVAVGGHLEDAVQIVREYVIALGGNPQVQVPVLGLRTNVRNSALLLGTMGHVLDFDDTHVQTILHGTTPVLSAALPIAQWAQRDGECLLTAFAVGLEVAVRTAQALGPKHYDAGWHVTGTAGAIGAVAAAANLMRLPSGQIRHALGVAATQAAAHREHFGTMSKSFGVGKAAANGVTAALLAARGFDAGSNPLEGRRAMFRTMSTESDSHALSQALGSRWELLDSCLKPYPCGVVTHPAIYAVLEIMRENALDPADVEAVQIAVNPDVFELTNKAALDGGLEGKFSISFLTAVAICRGAVRPGDFTPDRASATEIVDMRSKVSVTFGPEIARTAVNASITVRDGRTYDLWVPLSIGMPGNPMNTTQRVSKFHDLVDPVLGRSVGDHILEIVDTLEKHDTLEELVAATVP